MRNVIDAPLDYSRVETRGQPLEPVGLDAVLDDVLADLRIRIEESGGPVEVADLPSVEADVDQLRPLFSNLLSNALKYSGDEPSMVRVSGERDDEMVVVSVQDSGIGIAPGQQDRSFEMFQRLHSREERDGTGVGFALCQRIAERHGGDVEVESEPGVGTTFHVSLPAGTD